MNTIFSWLVLFCLLTLTDGFSQATRRRLPSSVNHPAINNYAPYMSLDGDALVFISDNAEDYALTPFFTSRSPRSDWKQPAELPKTIHTRLSYVWGYTLSPDGRILYFSTIKSPGVGGYDLWMCERNGAGWSQPVNLAAPINSRSNEASVTFTPDMKTMYFMRCEKMDQKTASGCVIMTAQRKANGQWGEPVALTSTINTGNSQAPRILADTETLIFSSDKFGGKGMDLYVTRLKGGEWTRPISMDFANTSGDDQFVSVNAVGRYLLRDTQGNRKQEMVEYLIPEGLRPKGLMRVEGTIEGSGGSPYISVLDLATGKRVYSGRPDSRGFFKLYLMEGSRYELSVDPERDDLLYYSDRFDLTGDTIEQVIRIAAQIKPVEMQDEIVLDLVQFREYSAELLPEAGNELKRVARLIKANRDKKFALRVSLTGYEQDSIRSTPDLTEVDYDTIWTQVTDIDSLGQLYQRDTCMVKVIYHNDRSQAQADAVASYLVGQGIPKENFADFQFARASRLPEEEKKVVVSVLITR